MYNSAGATELHFQAKGERIIFLINIDWWEFMLCEYLYIKDENKFFLLLHVACYIIPKKGDLYNFSALLLNIILIISL